MENEENKIQEKPQSIKQSFWELVRFAVLALIIVIPVRVFLVEPFVVSGSSMIPTFQNGNYLIIEKVSYKLRDPKRDDVVVFRYPKDRTKFFIKRVIGLPNETVEIKGNTVTIINKEHEDGFTLDEPYVKNISNNVTHLELKDDEYFVMGDNRNGSSDSRYWGAVKKDLLMGKVFLRLLPIKEIGILPGQYQQSNNQ